MNVPLIYCNGDSYSNDSLYESLQGRVYANFVARHTDAFVINRSRPGSCNRRIIRATVYDMIHQRQLNPDSKITALIQLTHEVRSEMWWPHKRNTIPEEADFITHQFTEREDWHQRLLNNLSLETLNDMYDLPQKWFDKYSQGRAFFYNPYAERINLFCDLVMMRALFESLNIEFVIFWGPELERLEPSYLLDFFQNQFADEKRLIRGEELAFIPWCCRQNFVPLDYLDRPWLGHYGSDAHLAWAEQILVPLMKDCGML